VSLPTKQRAALTHEFRCMAVDVTVVIVNPGSDPHALAARAEDVFRQVEKSCTRFDPTSPLMRANAAGEHWYEVPEFCYRALSEAAVAHRITGGRFDPRVLRDLQTLGYDRSLPFGTGPIHLAANSEPAQRTTLRLRAPWSPSFDPGRHAVRIGSIPVDLGGIGKGLAVRWAADEIRGQAEAFLVEAGGDLVTGGPGPGGDGWHAGVEDPRGGADPLAVLDVTDRGCATSSIRLRSWRVGGRLVHHILDPVTGEPGGDGLLSVTVLGPDPAAAEVWSKVLFLYGVDSIAPAAALREIPALWVDTSGRVATSPALAPYLLWQVPDGH
jgi:thiamine biosynthesis lipoprotein